MIRPDDRADRGSYPTRNDGLALGRPKEIEPNDDPDDA